MKRIFLMALGFACVPLAMNTPLIAAEKTEIAVPAPEAIIARLKPGHPRLLLSAGEFATLRVQTEKHARLKAWREKLRGAGTKMLVEEPSKYEIPDGKRLLATSRRVLARVSTLALLYRLDGDKKWLDRTWAELDAAAKFKDWNPSHFLDTGEMTYAFALGYDWLYDAWTPEQRAKLKGAIIKHGLQPGLAAYKGSKEGWWVKSQHNWNQVCNGGLGIGALALGDEEPALCGEILQNAIKSLPLAMQHFAPDGAWNEGPGYWHYATRYNIAILAALDSALGTDYGLSKIPGFSLTGDFPPYFTSPVNKVFNYADAGEKAGGAPQMFWLSTKFNQPTWATWQAKWADDKINAFDLIWGARCLAEPDGSPKTLPPLGFAPLGRYFRDSEVVSMRSEWDDSNAIFVGFKAGDNKANHSHLDIGSFVMDALGERWITDLGGDDYNLPAYFGGKRWTYYRPRAEGHNTLVINPDLSPDQDPRAMARITKFDLKDCCTTSVADLTPAYKNAQSVRRGVGLLESQHVLIQDEISAPNPAKIFWFAHTPAQIELTPDGKSATLSIGAKKVLARLLGPVDAKFSVLPAAPLPMTPQPLRQNANKGLQKLTVELNDVTSVRLRVLFTPLTQGVQLDVPPEKALNDW